MKNLSKMILVITLLCLSLIYSINAWCVATKEQWGSWIQKVNSAITVPPSCPASSSESMSSSSFVSFLSTSSTYEQEVIAFLRRINNQQLSEDNLYAILNEDGSLRFILNAQVIIVLLQRLPPEIASDLLRISNRTQELNHADYQDLILTVPPTQLPPAASSPSTTTSSSSSASSSSDGTYTSVVDSISSSSSSSSSGAAPISPPPLSLEQQQVQMITGITQEPYGNVPIDSSSASSSAHSDNIDEHLPLTSASSTCISSNSNTGTSFFSRALGWISFGGSTSSLSAMPLAHPSVSLSLPPLLTQSQGSSPAIVHESAPTPAAASSISSPSTNTTSVSGGDLSSTSPLSASGILTGSSSQPGRFRRVLNSVTAIWSRPSSQSSSSLSSSSSDQSQTLQTLRTSYFGVEQTSDIHSSSSTVSMMDNGTNVITRLMQSAMNNFH